MNEGPFRVSRPADRRHVSQPAQTAPQRPQPAVPSEQHRPQSDVPPVRTTKKARASKRFALPLTIGLVVVLMAVGGYMFLHRSTGAALIDTSKYQAVFFTNGQVYFGKLSTAGSESLRLTDIYYLQTKNTAQAGSENPQQTSTDQGDVELVKLGNEIHGPEDQMIISKDQVLFYENLKTDGKVAQSIAKSK